MNDRSAIPYRPALSVEGDVFAPGHLGELTQMVPFELVDAVLEETGRTECRLRILPSRVGVYFVLALGLFGHVGAGLVWQKLTHGLSGLVVPAPSEKALRDLRRRIGVAPLKTLFETLAVPLAQPSTPGARYRRWRTVAFDGCGSLKVPDHERNRNWLGKLRSRLGPAGYPTMMLMALVETGTRGVLGAAFGPTQTSETAYAARLLHLIDRDMLLLADRGFDSNYFLEAVAATGSQFLTRCRSYRRPPVLAVLSDGSYLTQISGLRLRVIEAEVKANGADGSTTADRNRLITTLTDHRTDPAPVLVRLYHERWEIESAFLALRHTLLRGRVLRSKDPLGIEQEVWALLTLYQAIRHTMVTAVETCPGIDPDRASFTIALEAARDTVVTAAGVLVPAAKDQVDLVGRIGRAVLAGLLPARRARFSARIVKAGTSRYHSWNRRPDDYRPLTSTNITTVEVTVHEPPPKPVRKPQALTPGRRPAVPRSSDQAGHPAPTGTRWQVVQAILQQAPEHARRAEDLAAALGITGKKKLHSFYVQMSAWASRGRLVKVVPGTYQIAPQPAMDTAP
ncbi:IS4 family transposase [Streptomyces sp. NPDC057543]|uniref:IS4 family transposase n=1 Tax=Streptomyces sp. NPDC057543 TaxID=3346163 RepID=UPI0036A683B8